MTLNKSIMYYFIVHIYRGTLSDVFKIDVRVFADISVLLPSKAKAVVFATTFVCLSYMHWSIAQLFGQILFKHMGIFRGLS